jgi:Serine acetyltransferase
MKTIELIREDFSVNSHAKAKFVLAFYRIAHASLRGPRLLRTTLLPLRLIYRVVVDWILGIDIPCRTKLGRRIVIYHGHALVINEGAIIGDDCILRHCVTIGNKLTAEGETTAPHIGNRVEFGAGAVVIGPVHIGDGARIGALSVVTKSVPPGVTVIGNPARPLPPPISH